MPICFVVQGFGEKTDFTTGKKFNLDASYAVIKEAVEAAGLQCIRADEIKHAGMIDVPMYQHILRADLVIADLSTYNVNAAYELGVRYAMRPRTTIVVAESGFRYPFDVSHITIQPYKHLGEDIGSAEARRFKRDLEALIRELMAKPKTDSPVYDLLQLTPPAELPAPAAGSVTRGGFAAHAGVAEAGAPAARADASAKDLLDQAEQAMAAGDFLRAKSLLQATCLLRPHDDALTQKIALATYKSEKPTPRAALEEARNTLLTLRPEISNDPETLGLWSAIHKRLWVLTGERAQLDESVTASERGYYLKSDYYNGINFAFVLNERAAVEEKEGAIAEAIADFIAARRVRREVLKFVEHALKREDPLSTDERYWIEATALQAAIGLEDPAVEAKWAPKVQQAKVADWMHKSTDTQINKLRALLASSPLRHLQ